MIDSEQKEMDTIFDAIGIAARLVFAVALGTAGLYLVIASDDHAIYLSGVAMMYAALWLMAAVFKEG